jgi:RNAse (barnase) inhibitor barstar
VTRCLLRGPYATLEAVHADLARQLGLAGHYGVNLDALWDALVRDVPGPVEISWPDFARAQSVLGGGADRLRALLEEAAAERRDVTVAIGPSSD